VVPPVQQSVLVGQEKLVVRGKTSDVRPVVAASDQVAPPSLEVRTERCADEPDCRELAMQNDPLHDKAWRLFVPAGTVDDAHVAPPSWL
jgi:hypothetical protein